MNGIYDDGRSGGPRKRACPARPSRIVHKKHARPAHNWGVYTKRDERLRRVYFRGLGRARPRGGGSITFRFYRSDILISRVRLSGVLLLLCLVSAFSVANRFNYAKTHYARRHQAPSK